MEQEQADRIEAKLDYIIAKITEVENLIAVVGPALSANPMLKQFLPRL